MSTTVRTRCALDAFVNCGPYTALDQLGVTCDDVRITTLVVEVEMNSDGTLTMLPTSPEVDGTWCDYACAARDRYEQNMEVFIDDSARGEAAVRATRTVLRGEHLFVWFEDSLARQRNIPILTPANIRGKDEYVCTYCGTVFQQPNPLKSHIRYHCSIISSDSSSTCSSSPWATHNLFLPAAPSSAWLLPAWNTTPLVLATLAAARSHTGSPHVVTSQAGTAGDGASENAGTWYMLNYLQRVLRTDSASAASTVKLRRDFTADATSDVTVTSTGVEPSRTMTSSLQQVRRKPGAGGGGGYVCPYCGKFYSRRYGLKIHVRTHTGFKPLQCPVCRRAFGDPSNLNKHVRLHTQSSPAAPYRCRHCGKVLVRRRDLDRHVRARHPDLQLPPSNDDVSKTDVMTSSECVSADDSDMVTRSAVTVD